MAVAFLLLFDFTLVTNIFNIGSLFAPMAAEFSESVAGLGALVSAYVLGRAVFELPGSLFAVRKGPKTLLTVGGCLASVPIILSGLSTSFTEVLVLRCIGGAGFGFCFPQVTALIARNVRETSAGMAMGLLFMTSNLAGMTGLFGYAELGLLLGWRESVFLSGGLLLAATLAMALAVRDDRTIGSIATNRHDVVDTLLNRQLLILALLLIGIGGGSYLTWNFSVYYLQTQLGVPVALAGLLAGLAPAFALMAPLAGKGYDRFQRMRLWILAAGAVMAGGLALASNTQLDLAVASVALVGAAQGVGFTVVFASVRGASGQRARLEPLAFGWVDTLSLLGPLFAPVVFSTVALRSGYSAAWLFGGGFTAVFLLPLLFYKVRPESPKSHPPAPASVPSSPGRA
ncbi:MAG TPA: MFS transporter [Nitrososphaerales archaeon]|nr:MFS transporter [Nitrososphaerales archaeon]